MQDSNPSTPNEPDNILAEEQEFRKKKKLKGLAIASIVALSYAGLIVGVAVSGAGRTETSFSLPNPPTPKSSIAPTPSTSVTFPASPTLSPTPSPTPSPTEIKEGPYKVVTVVDGDTYRLTLPNGEETIRLIGVNTPETKDPRKAVECYGPEATKAGEALVGGKEVWLERDPSQGDKDKYGRTLGYLWLEDGTLINEALISNGSGVEDTHKNKYKYRDRFLAAQKDAKDSGKGLWAQETCGGKIKPMKVAPTTNPPTTNPPTTNPPTTNPPTTNPPTTNPPKPTYQAPETTAPPSTKTSTSYANCTEVREAGAAPLYKGSPGYSSKLDRDGDGVACEK